MAVITTYICDVSGVSGTVQADFVEVSIIADNSKIPGIGYSQRTKLVKRLVHIDVARKLNLVYSVSKEEHVPEPTFESKLAILLKERIEEIAYEVAEDVVVNYNSRG
jgi:hypothetical protein